MILNLKYNCVVCFSDTALSPKTEANSSSPKVRHQSTKSKRTWHYPVDVKHDFCHVKFEKMFVIFFKRKSTSNKK
jgi:hypothetical protein